MNPVRNRGRDLYGVCTITKLNFIIGLWSVLL